MGPVGSIWGSVEESLIVSARARIVSGKSGSVPPNCIHFVVVLWNRLLFPRPQLRCSGFSLLIIFISFVYNSHPPPFLLTHTFSVSIFLIISIFWRACVCVMRNLLYYFFLVFLLGWYLGDYSCFPPPFYFSNILVGGWSFPVWDWNSEWYHMEDE